jgi:hypothetical protein
MPLASPPVRPKVVYGFGRIDSSGRVADRVTIAALGWRGGDRLTLTVRPVRTARSWPLLVLAAPATTEVWSGWVSIAQKTAGIRQIPRGAHGGTRLPGAGGGR